MEGYNNILSFSRVQMGSAGCWGAPGGRAVGAVLGVWAGALWVLCCSAGLCKSREHQGQTAIWGEAPSPPASETGMQIVTALERWHRALLHRSEICSSSAFPFPMLFTPSLHCPFCISVCIFYFFSSISKLFLVFFPISLQAVFV